MAISKALYFAAILPPSQLNEQVQNLKLEFQNRFSASHALKLPAHLTLIPPVWLEDHQETPFLKAVEAVTESQSQFPVSLNDFGYFGQRSVFINVTGTEALRELHQNLLRNLKDFGTGENDNFSPHFTLATRDLTRENFQMAWEEFRNREFEGEFNAVALTIFKHTGKVWEVLEEFDFRGKR